jgi:hypothetical protein
MFGGPGTVARALLGTRSKEMVMGFAEFKTFSESP